MSNFPEIRQMGEKAILIEYAPEIAHKILDKVLIAKELVLKSSSKVSLEVVTAYNSLLVYYHSPIEDVYQEENRLRLLLAGGDQAQVGPKKIFHIPVCYQGEYAPDLERLSITKNMEKEELIHMHCQPLYMVYFIGFLPGFLYLGNLPKRLYFPRKKEPRVRVPKGSVGIGGEQTGIYPMESPGGWQIIGRSPVCLFDVQADPPCLVSAGDRIRFYAVTPNEYQEIKQQVHARTFQIKEEDYGGN